MKKKKPVELQPVRNCPCCNSRITEKNPEGTPCPRCEEPRCDNCDLGHNVICPQCESGRE